jgi:hypothetical protein
MKASQPRNQERRLRAEHWCNLESSSGGQVTHRALADDDQALRAVRKSHGWLAVDGNRRPADRANPQRPERDLDRDVARIVADRKIGGGMRRDVEGPGRRHPRV